MRKILYKVHSTVPPANCGIGIFTEREMREALNQPRVGGVIYDAHYRNKENDLPVDTRGIGIKYTTCLCDESIDVGRKADEALRDAEAANEVRQELVVYFAHEYGIFRDGKKRDFLVPLMKACRKKGLITILHPHTVLSNPEKYGDDYRGIMEGAVQEADLILGMTPSAIDMLEDIYDAPRENMVYNPHGVDMFSLNLNRLVLKERYFGRLDFNLWLSGGFFSAGKKIDEAIRAFGIYRDKFGDDNWKYLVLGLQKDGGHVDKCFNIAKDLGMNPINFGEGRADIDLEKLKRYDLSKHNVVFFNAFPNVRSSHEAKLMSDAVFIVNESDSQISSGEIVKALSAKRVVFSYKSPIAIDLAKESGVFVIDHGNVRAFAESLNFFCTRADKKRLELSSGITSTRFEWSKPVRNLVDATAVIVDKREEDKLEERVNSC